jgi:hypothetical protein
VILIIDVSLSMNEQLEGEYNGKAGQTRIEVAKAEMDKAIQSLEPAAFFNVIAFSSDVTRWLEGGLQAASQKNRDEAQAFVDKTLLAGGTSTYDALKIFWTPTSTLIFFLSDGEPTTGEEVDPIVMHAHVKRWNKHRGIVINAIARWESTTSSMAAEDSGGAYKSYE